MQNPKSSLKNALMLASSRKRNRTCGRLLRFALVPLALILPMCTVAQSIGTISGQVKDPSGAAVPGATITIQNTDTNLQRTVMTGEEGSYTAPALPVGPYSVKVEHAGFLVNVETGLKLDVAQQLVVNVALQVGSTSQEVTVAGEVELVNTTSGSLSNMVDSNQLSNLPLNGRSYENLSLMEPGINQNKNFNTAAVGGSPGVQFSSNGAMLRSNNYLLDGTILESLNGINPASANGTTLGLDGIKEYRLITNSFSAEYGTTMGSQTVMVSKSGSNQLHGTAFEYLRNSVLDAANYFATPLNTGGGRIAPFKENNFGGSLGGPIKKDRTFVFGTYEGFRQRLGVSTIDTVLPVGCHGGLGAVITPAACSLVTTNVTIGSASPAVVPFLALFPNPNLPNNGYTFPYTQPTQEDYGQVRVDQNFNSKDSVFARYTIDNSAYTRTASYPISTDRISSRNQYLTLGETHIFSPAVLATARLSFARTGIFFTTTVEPSLLQPQYEFIPGNFFAGVGPGSGVTGLANNGSTPLLLNQNIFSGGYDLVYDRGRHQLKFGAALNYYQTGNSFVQTKGSASFANVASFLQGVPLTISGNLPGAIQQSILTFFNPAFYVQDDVKIMPRLTLNLGLRYEFTTTPNKKNGVAYALHSITDATTTQGAILANHSYHDFSPRFGFAWDVFGNGRTSVRGGVDYLYDMTSWMSNFQLSLDSGTPPLAMQFAVPNPGPLPVPFPLATIKANPTSLGVGAWYYSGPKLLSWNLTVERQLPGAMSLSVGYVGSRAFNLYQQAQPDVVVSMSSLGQTPGPNAQGGGVVTNGIGCDGQPSPRPNGTECWGPKTPTCSAVLPTCRVNPHYTSILGMGWNSSTSWYNALDVILKKQVTRGLQFQTSYVWSRMLDDGGNLSSDLTLAGGGSPTDPDHPLVDWGPSVFDVTHNWRFNAIYHFPNVNSDRRSAMIIKGWWISGIASVQTGYPFNPTLAINRSLSGVALVVSDRPDIVTSANLATALKFDPLAQVFNNSAVTLGSTTQWFNPHMFTLGPVGYLGDAGRDMLRGPGATNIDFTVAKDTPLAFLGEAGSLGFRAEFFNIPNHPNFAMPSNATFTGTAADAGELPLTTAGRITATVDSSRQIQLSLRISF